jgi:hypothetical protein
MALIYMAFMNHEPDRKWKELLSLHLPIFSGHGQNWDKYSQENMLSTFRIQSKVGYLLMNAGVDQNPRSLVALGLRALLEMPRALCMADHEQVPHLCRLNLQQIEQS